MTFSRKLGIMGFIVFSFFYPGSQNRAAFADVVARYRIPLKLVEYRPVVVKKTDGTLKSELKPFKQKQVTLRARIDIPNHFYIGEWHIETVPVKFTNHDKKYRLLVRFSKVYGVKGTLEESVGFLELDGNLKGKNYLYQFHGYAKKTFKSKNLKLLLQIELGSENKNLARSKSRIKAR